MKILAVDPGEKRIGIAISDENGLLARPLAVIRHTARAADAAAIIQAAAEQGAALIVVGQALGGDGEATLQSVQAANLARALAQLSAIPVVLWDESGSTQAARELRLLQGAPQRKRGGHQDALAAAIILQDYLDHAPGRTNG